VSGSVRASIFSASGKEVSFQDLQAGQMFNEIFFGKCDINHTQFASLLRTCVPGTIKNVRATGKEARPNGLTYSIGLGPGIQARTTTLVPSHGFA
jgi:hypothetical protein